MVGTADRRARKRLAKREAILAVAADIVEADGIDACTIAAVAEAADYAPASLYTYFPSRSALIAAVQRDALATLVEVGEAALSRWQEQLADRKDVDAPTAALAILWAVSDMFLAAPDAFTREYRPQQELLVNPPLENLDDASSVVPVAMGLLALPHRMLAEASDTGALSQAPGGTNAIDEAIDGTMLRTLAWFTALHGALLIDGLSVGVGTTGRELGSFVTRSFLAGWGAEEDCLNDARSVANMLDSAEAVRHQQ
jgi:AcrR family transcriptional regulator